jgi:hypothetical protein
VVGSGIQVRIFTLEPGDVIPWHYHSESTDHYFVLRGPSRRMVPNRRPISPAESDTRSCPTSRIAFRTKHRPNASSCWRRGQTNTTGAIPIRACRQRSATELPLFFCASERIALNTLFAALHESDCGPTPPTWALRQVGTYLGYIDRGANRVAAAALPRQLD